MIGKALQQPGFAVLSDLTTLRCEMAVQTPCVHQRSSIGEQTRLEQVCERLSLEHKHIPATTNAELLFFKQRTAL